MNREVVDQLQTEIARLDADQVSLKLLKAFHEKRVEELSEALYGVTADCRNLLAALYVLTPDLKPDPKAMEKKSPDPVE